MLIHNVYLTLKDDSPEAIDALIASADKYLKGLPGITLFARGKLVPDLVRPVNDLDFHVGIHVVFGSREDHDRYQVSAGHQQFLAENQPNWARARVFDSSDV